MTSPAATALEKILNSFSRKSKNVSRLQAFSQVARLYNDLDERRVYPDIPDHARDFALHLLKYQALSLYSHPYLGSSPTLIVRGLAHTLMTKFVPQEHLGKWHIFNLNRHIHRAANEVNFAPLFNQALHEIAENPEAYPIRDLSDVMDNVVSVPPQNGLLSLIFQSVTGYLMDERKYLLSRLGDFAYQFDHDKNVRDIEESYTPKHGPDSPDEFWLMVGLLDHHLQNPFLARAPNYAAVNSAMKKLRQFAYELCDDIPFETRLRYMKEITPESRITFARAGITPLQSPIIAVAMGRYYLERHRDKISSQKSLFLNEALINLYIESYQMSYEMRARQIGRILTDEERHRAIDTMVHETWRAWPRPSVDDLIQHTDALLHGKKRQKFFEGLEAATASFDFEVSFYSEQHETLRKLRRNLFKKDSLTGEQEAYRKTFLKHLADQHAETLTSLGFSQSAITFMSRTGQISEQFAPQFSGWTVDHIIDLHAGGTNDISNFCLMPAELNKLKNDMLLLQTGLHEQDELKSGFWVITLRPKMNYLSGAPILAQQPPQIPAHIPQFGISPD